VSLHEALVVLLRVGEVVVGQGVQIEVRVLSLAQNLGARPLLVMGGTFDCVSAIQFC
jgi:hypothetical protein